MHTALAVALVAGATLVLPVSRTAPPPGPRAPAARALPQEPKKAEKAEKEGKQERHPEINRSIRRLEQAKADLEKASHDYGGHRVAAIKSIDEALGHLHEALNFDKK